MSTNAKIDAAKFLLLAAAGVVAYAFVSKKFGAVGDAVAGAVEDVKVFTNKVLESPVQSLLEADKAILDGVGVLASKNPYAKVVGGAWDFGLTVGNTIRGWFD